MRDQNVCHWSAISILVLVPSFTLIIDFCMLANSLPASLQPRQSLCHDHEKYALLQFKQSFFIDCSMSHPAFARPKVNSWWESSSNDHMANISTSHTSDCCWWDGVKCSEETGHLIGLDLSSSCLYGTFSRSSSLFGLDHLRELDLSDNDFNFSSIPSTIGHLSRLTKLNLSQSAFSGRIPLEISALSNLSVLDLSLNSDLELQYDLSFEKLVGSLPRLTQLHLDAVNISSAVPLILSNFTSLKALSLDGCNLYGTFPPSIFQLPKLELVDLGFNENLGGFLPEFPSNSPLTSLDLSETSFSGELTPSIGNLGSLTELILWNTGFTGPIPSSLGNLTKLTDLEIKYNINGDFPLSITNLTQLTAFSLFDLSIKPQILNSWLLKLTKLEKLALHDTNLWGEIPSSLANLTRLNWLDLGSNQLTGPLPLWLGNLTKLTFLDLYGSQFQGPIIPWWFSQLTNLDTLYLSSNGSVAMFDTILKLPYLRSILLSGINLIFSPNTSTNSSSLPKFGVLGLQLCNLTEFPQFLRYQDKLQSLQLPANNIKGNIPQWFVNSTAESLLELDLGDNFLTGFEQPQVFLPWNNLEAFYMEGNKLQDQLLSPPSSLQVYQVYGNLLSGVFPKQICKASSLTYLDLSGNNLSGKIPTCVGTHLGASLQVLNLRGNHFQGTIPRTFTKACKLKMINLSDNQLEGQIPESFTNCGVLEVLDVGKNRLNDVFPTWLGNLPKLQVLVLRHNKFHGRIATPKSGYHFRYLRVIDLSYNLYVGNLPSTYLQNWLAMKVTAEDQSGSSESDIEINFSTMDMTWEKDNEYHYEITMINKGSETLYSKILNVFRVIDFSSNNFTGEIPDFLGKLRGLQALNLSNNHLIGRIPSSLANIVDLEALDFSQNMLSGGIPQQLTRLTSLEIFNVSHNRLVGLIPQGNQFNTFDNSSFEGNLALCGVPLSKKCENRYSPQLPPSMTNDETEEDSKLINWIIRSLGCASGCIVGFIIGKIYITDKHHNWFMETFGRRRPKTRARNQAPSRRGNR